MSAPQAPLLNSSTAVRRLIPDIPYIAMLVLAANAGPEGPGPLISAMTAAVGTFPVPIVIVPGDLSDAEIDALS